MKSVNELFLEKDLKEYYKKLLGKRIKLLEL